MTKVSNAKILIELCRISSGNLSLGGEAQNYSCNKCPMNGEGAEFVWCQTLLRWETALLKESTSWKTPFL